MEPPPLVRILYNEGFNQFGKLGGVVEDIVLFVVCTIELKRRFDDELMMV